MTWVIKTSTLLGTRVPGKPCYKGTVININYHAPLSTEDRLVSQLLAQGRGFLLSSLKSYRIATSQKGKEGMKERITFIIFTLKISHWYFRGYSNPNCAKCFGNYLSCCLPSTQLVCWMPSARLLWWHYSHVTKCSPDISKLPETHRICSAWLDYNPSFCPHIFLYLAI